MPITEDGSTIATIATGTSQSDEIRLSGTKLVGLHLPAAWTSAAITFLVAPTTGGTYQALYDDDGIEVTIASANVVASRSIAIDTLSGKLAPFQWLKIRSGTAASPVNQAATRTIGVSLE